MWKRLGKSCWRGILACANPLYYALIEAFEQETGVPVVLNTSFNLKGEPIVNTPDNAISTFLRATWTRW